MLFISNNQASMRQHQLDAAAATNVDGKITDNSA
jgi:hypothetical protein